MRKYCMFSIFVLSLFPHKSTIQAQEIDPTTWSIFVNRSDIPVVSDTFKMQTFTENPNNNWNYTASDNSSLFNAKEEGITDSSNGLSLKLPGGSFFETENISHGSYTNVKIHCSYAAWRLMEGEILILNSDRDKGGVYNVKWETPTDNYFYSFKTNKPKSYTNKSALRISDNPYNMRLDVLAVPKRTKNGFYALDSVFAHGDTKLFSLFTGEGSWHNYDHWTHNPALRHRHALINGDVTVDNYTTCRQLFLGEGSIHIAPQKDLQIQKLTFCSNNATLSSEGNITIEEGITIYRTFPKKGKWYFISFPFDVYKEGLDSNFELKDDTPNNGGNYFYIHTYDGIARSIRQNSNGNWKVLSPNSLTDNEPVFKKGKGYLIALDELAQQQTLCFSSRKGAIPTDFGQKAIIPIETAEDVSDLNEKDHGWYLCGNPLPAPLPLSRIEANDHLDGYIYIYEEYRFRPYSLNSNFVIPPFSAFFVKAKQSTQLYIHELSPNHRYKFSNTFDLFALSEIRSEPKSTSATSFSMTNGQNSYVDTKENILILKEIRTPGAVYIVDFMGKHVWWKEVNSGSTIIQLPSTLTLNKVYLLIIETSLYRAQHKFILTQ